jgi:AraC family transcriptional regulator of adaptative response/methylated-DNA-[protein]-cysteine methyltransferase
MLAGATEEGVCLLDFVDRHDLETQFKTFSDIFKLPLIPGVNRHLELLRDELAGYFAGSLQTFSVPLVFTGTPFQQEVWQQLRAIPYGATCSYADIAAALDRPRAVRAVGSANGRNLISIVVPCHRVVTKGGQPGGYRGGVRRKQYLLQLERETAGPVGA